MEQKIYFSSNLKYLRTINHKTLEEIGNIVDKTKSTISKWEKGTREPYATDVYTIARYFDVSVDDLIFKDLRFIDSKLDSKLQNKLNGLTDEQKEKIINMIDIIK